MNVGIVGVGRWAQRLKAAFERQGHAITAHDRRTAAPIAGFGTRVPWQAMLQDPDIHAVVVAADPDTVHNVGHAAAQHGKPVLLTKPVLLKTPLVSPAPVFVDYVRLAAPAYACLKQRTQAPRHVRVRMYGNGPCRSFPGVFDYGPHATAFMCDLLGLVKPEQVQSWVLVFAESRELFLARGRWAGVPFDFVIGNGAASAQTSLEVTCDTRTVTYTEERGTARCIVNGSVVQEHAHQDSIDAFVRLFVTDVETRRTDPRWATMSVIGTWTLSMIRTAAEQDL